MRISLVFPSVKRSVVLAVNEVLATYVSLCYLHSDHTSAFPTEDFRGKIFIWESLCVISVV